MRAFTCFLSVSLLLVLTSCEKDEVVKTKTYLDYPGFVREGLVAYYPMNGDVMDYSGNGHVGILHGATPSADRFDGINGAYSFDGEDDFIEILNSSRFNSNNGTICLWMRVPYLAEDRDEFYRAILSKAGTSDGGAVINQGSDYRISTIIKYPDPVGKSFIRMGFAEAFYIFIAITFAENSLASYHDGELLEEHTYTPEWLFNNNQQNVYIGKSLIDDDEIHHYKNFKGEIDDVLIYDRTLTDIEIQQLSSWRKE